MGLNVPAYGASGKKLKLASLGLKSIRADNANHRVIMELADGSTESLTFDVLKELSDVEQIDDSNEIKFIFSDGSKSEPIKVPTVKSIRRYKTTAEAEADIESIIADDIEQVIIEDEDPTVGGGASSEELEEIKQNVSDLADELEELKEQGGGASSEEVAELKTYIEENIISIEETEGWVTKDVEIVNGWFDRTTADYAYSGVYRSAMLDVTEGEKYRLSGCSGSSNKKGFLLAYDGTTWSTIAYTGAKEVFNDYEYTVPSSISKIVVQGEKNTNEVKVEKWEHVVKKVVQFEENPLKGKKIGVVGDSICYGNGYVGGYAKIIADNNQMTMQNLGIGSTRIIAQSCASTVITSIGGARTELTVLTSGAFDPSKVDFTKTDDFGTVQYCKRSWNSSTTNYDITIVTQSEWNGTDELYIVRRPIPDRINYLDNDCDYVIAEGGYNDVASTPFGTLTSGYDSALDLNTIYGGMEQLCRNMINKFEGKKLGFIFVHKILDYPYTVKENGKGTMTEYFEKMKEVLNKYSIPYLDLFNESTLNTGISAYLKYTHQNDGTHPNEDGYRKFYVPKIEAWLKTL